MELNSALLTFLFTLSMNADPIKVAVIDTGSNSLHKLSLCEDGHVDFTKNTPKYYNREELLDHAYADFRDNEGHGTNISHLLQDEAGSANYCQMIIKYANGMGDPTAFSNTLKAFKHSIKQKVNVINYSSAGLSGIKSEKKIVRDIIKANIVLLASAGNNSKNLDKKCESFPACYYKDTIVVGSGFDKKTPASYSNRGEIVDVWVNGTHQKANGTTLSGTSQSTAIATGKFIKMIDKLRKFLNER